MGTCSSQENTGPPLDPRNVRDVVKVPTVADAEVVHIRCGPWSLCHKKRRYVPDEFIEKADWKKLRRKYKARGVSKSMLRTEFIRYCRSNDHSYGTVLIERWLKFFDTAQAKLLLRLIRRRFGVVVKRVLFEEAVDFMWDVCVLDLPTLINICTTLIVPGRKRTVASVRAIARWLTDDHLTDFQWLTCRMLRPLRDGQAVYGKPDLLDLYMRYPTLVHPLLHFQRTMQKRFLGFAFWEKWFKERDMRRFPSNFLNGHARALTARTIMLEAVSSQASVFAFGQGVPPEATPTEAEGVELRLPRSPRTAPGASGEQEKDAPLGTTGATTAMDAPVATTGVVQGGPTAAETPMAAAAAAAAAFGAGNTPTPGPGAATPPAASDDSDGQAVRGLRGAGESAGPAPEQAAVAGGSDSEASFTSGSSYSYYTSDSDASAGSNDDAEGDVAGKPRDELAIARRVAYRSDVPKDGRLMVAQTGQDAVAGLVAAVGRDPAFRKRLREQERKTQFAIPLRYRYVSHPRTITRFQECNPLPGGLAGFSLTSSEIAQKVLEHFVSGPGAEQRIGAFPCLLCSRPVYDGPLLPPKDAHDGPNAGGVKFAVQARKRSDSSSSGEAGDAPEEAEDKIVVRRRIRYVVREWKETSRELRRRLKQQRLEDEERSRQLEGGVAGGETAVAADAGDAAATATKAAAPAAAASTGARTAAGASAPSAAVAASAAEDSGSGAPTDPVAAAAAATGGGGGASRPMQRRINSAGLEVVEESKYEARRAARRRMALLQAKEHTGFCLDCDRYLFRVLSEGVGYRTATRLLRAASPAHDLHATVQKYTRYLRSTMADLQVEPFAVASYGYHRPEDQYLELFDEETHEFFYYNVTTGRSQWVEPRGFSEFDVDKEGRNTRVLQDQHEESRLQRTAGQENQLALQRIQAKVAASAHRGHLLE